MVADLSNEGGNRLVANHGKCQSREMMDIQGRGQSLTPSTDVRGVRCRVQSGAYRTLYLRKLPRRLGLRLFQSPSGLPGSTPGGSSLKPRGSRSAMVSWY